VLNRDKIITLEIAMLILHAQAVFVIYDQLMLLPIAICRLPRFIMIGIIAIFFSKFETQAKKKWYTYECYVRLATCVLMPLFSIGIQCNRMIKTFCPMHIKKGNEEACIVRYGATMGILILIGTVIDILI
jgi:hypothetical protein